MAEDRKSRVRLVHWNADESSATRQVLADAGFAVEYEPTFSTALMRGWREHPPDFFVIDLSRLPAHGMEVAIALRQSTKTKLIPIVFCGGALEKVKRVCETLPDAAFCSLDQLVKTVKATRPLQSAIKPTAMMDRYATRTAAQKLGIQAGSKVTLIDPPSDVHHVLGELPGKVEFVDKNGTVTLCFVRSLDGLRAEISHLREVAANSKLWILWRKRGAPHHDGLTEMAIRETALDLGLVDYKICSVNPTWSALCFALKQLR